MGGQMNVESKPGIGTSFYFTLNFDKELTSETEGKTNDKQEAQGATLSGIRILLVEDQEFNQFVAKKLLEILDATIDIASNGKIAIKKLSENNYDIILMDIQMPVMDGIEATSFIRKHMTQPKSEIPIIALTAHALKGDDQKYIALGMDGYLSKPFKSADLSKVILKTLSGQEPTPPKNTSKPEDEIKTTLYDLSSFHEMASGNAGFFENIISSFINSTRKGINEINKNIQSSNYPGIKISAHTVKPGFKMIGRDDIFEMLEQIEKLAVEQAEVKQILELSGKIEDIFNSIEIEMKKRSGEI
jgi:CheY-like chemotaxis protein